MSDGVDPLAAGGPTTRDLPTPTTALVVAAHPDDAEFQAGATLAKWARAGCEVHHLVLTDGALGTWDPEVDPAVLVATRHAEQRAAAAVLRHEVDDACSDAGGQGRERVHLLDLPDGGLTATVATRGLVAEVIRRVRPQVVLGHDPWKRYRLHPDHAVAGRLCVDGIVAARDPGFHREQLDAGLAPHRPDALLLFEADVANHAESVSLEDHRTRLAALECFTSQLTTTHLYKVDGTGEDAISSWRSAELDRLRAVGRWAGLETAEAFHLIVDQL